MQKFVAETTFQGKPQFPIIVCAATPKAAVDSLTSEGYVVQSVVMCVTLDPAAMDRIDAMLRGQERVLSEVRDVASAVRGRALYRTTRDGVFWGLAWFALVVFLLLSLLKLAEVFVDVARENERNRPNGSSNSSSVQSPR